jgi:tRNA (mo5U34)-methyltransferase
MSADLETRARAIAWCHPIDLGQGVVTRPDWHIRRRFARRLRLLDLPPDLSGQTVLDIGAWDGFFSFECERRGAARVLAIDTYAWDHHGQDGFLLAREALGSRVESQRLAAEDLDPAAIGQFDLVITRGVLVCETHTLIPVMHGRYPLISFFPGDGLEAGSRFEFCAIPTEEALTQMLRSAGFTTIDVKHRPSWRIVKQLTALVTNRPQSGRLIVHAR